MSRTLEKTLTMLLPTHSSGVPRELIELTSSLLNQSRHRISNLNSSEEPAREMICAHLACDKLKHKLALPSVKKPPAPVPPKTYDVLYRQFSDVLFPAKTPVSTPQKSKQAATSTPTSSRRTNANTPTRKSATKLKTSLTQFLPDKPSSARKQPASSHSADIDSICIALSALNAKKHIIEAFNTIASSFKYRPLATHPQALIGALYIVVTQRLFVDSKRKSLKQAQAQYSKLRSDVYRELDLDEADIATTRFDEIVQELISEDVRESAWYQKIPGGSGLNVDGEEDGEEEEEEEEEEEGVEKDTHGKSIVIVGKEDIPTPNKAKRTRSEMERASGVGSMMQDRVIYLSEKRRTGYAEWKAKILQQVNELQMADD